MVAGSTGLAVRDAEACQCSWSGAEVSVPTVVGEPIDLLGEEVELRCDRAARTFIVCDWVARYRLRNPGAERTIAFAVDHPAGAAVTLRLGEAVAATAAGAGREEQRQAAAARRTGSTLGTWSARAGEEVALVVEARFLVRGKDCGCVLTTNTRRHPWVTRNQGQEYDVEYVYPEGVKFRVEPSTWQLRHDIPAGWQVEDEHRRQGRRKLLVDRWPRVPPETASRWDRGWGVGVRRPWQFEPGGPIAAAGIGWSPEGLRPRVRVGWETAWPHWVVHSVAVETDTRRRVAVVPAWELTWPRRDAVVPELAVGLGVPVQVTPAVRSGVRLHWRFGYWIFHLIGTFDHFPGGRGLARERLGSLLLQVGF